MPILVDWGNEEEDLLVWKFEGNWTLEEYSAALKQALEYIDAKRPMPVDILVDLRRSRLTPRNLLGIARDGLRTLQTLSGIAVLISVTGFWSQIYEVVYKTYFAGVPMPLYFVRSVDDAYERINQARDARASQTRI